jgi:death on curing protein
MVIRINEQIVNVIHNYVVRRLVAVDGIIYSGTISGPLERVFGRTFGGQKYHHVLDKAGAILYSIVHGHSFTDGNKRTGLLSTYLFLMINGYMLNPPQNTTTVFLEKMADALDPDAPTEKDAIAWVRQHSKMDGSALFTYASLSFACFLVGTDYIAYWIQGMLDTDTLPYRDKDKLVDKTLRNGMSKPVSICSED